MAWCALWRPCQGQRNSRRQGLGSSIERARRVSVSLRTPRLRSSSRYGSLGFRFFPLWRLVVFSLSRVVREWSGWETISSFSSWRFSRVSQRASSSVFLPCFLPLSILGSGCGRTGCRGTILIFLRLFFGATSVRVSFFSRTFSFVPSPNAFRWSATYPPSLSVDPKVLFEGIVTGEGNRLTGFGKPLVPGYTAREEAAYGQALPAPTGYGYGPNSKEGGG